MHHLSFRTARPGVAAVCRPSLTTGTPFTRTCRTPSETWCGLLVGRAIDDRSGVEHDDVRECPLTKHAAVSDRQARRHRGRHLPDRLLERHHTVLAHVSAECARIVAVRARVGHAPGTLGVVPASIGAELHPGLSHLEHQVLLRRNEEDAADAVLFLDRQVDHDIYPIGSAPRRDVREAQPLERLVLFLREGHHHHTLGRREAAQTLPLGELARGVGVDACAHHRVAKVVEKLPIGGCPRRQARRQIRRASDVRVHVGGDVLPRPTR